MSLLPGLVLNFGGGPGRGFRCGRRRGRGLARLDPDHRLGGRLRVCRLLIRRLLIRRLLIRRLRCGGRRFAGGLRRRGGNCRRRALVGRLRRRRLLRDGRAGSVVRSLGDRRRRLLAAEQQVPKNCSRQDDGRADSCKDPLQNA
ncbi:MAG: hypothetical protein Tsb0032_28080 [Kiloniellaceae bacterium]